TEGFNLINILRIGVDIALVWYVIYKLIMIIRGTKAIQLLKGIFVVVIVWVLSIVLDLHTIQWLTNQAILWGFLVIIILFQPELRRALEQLGRGSLFTRTGRSEEEKIDKVIDSLVASAEYMGKRRIGALITIEQETGIDDYAETGTLIDGVLTSQLLTTYSHRTHHSMMEQLLFEKIKLSQQHVTYHFQKVHLSLKNWEQDIVQL